MVLIKSLIRFLQLSFLAATLSGCLAPAKDPVYTQLDSGGSTSISTVASVDADLYLKFETAPRTSPDSYTTRVLCAVNVGGTTPQTCSVRVSEALLFLSGGKMTYGTRDKTLCKSIIFKPFWYLGNNTSTNYRAPWDPAASPDGVDCNTGGSLFPTSADCYNGAAKEMVGGFPLVSGVRFLSTQGIEGRSTYTSPWEKGQYGDNTWLTNNISPGDRAAGIVNRLVAPFTIPGAGSPTEGFQDWSVACMDDEDEEILQINLTISDKDTVAGTPTPIDDYFDWNDGL